MIPNHPTEAMNDRAGSSVPAAKLGGRQVRPGMNRRLTRYIGKAAESIIPYADHMKNHVMHWRANYIEMWGTGARRKGGNAAPAAKLGGRDAAPDPWLDILVGIGYLHAVVVCAMKNDLHFIIV